MTCVSRSVALGIGFIAAVGAVIGLAVAFATKGDSSSTNVCTSDACVDLSNQILEALDESIDPCDDFYKFACNKFDQQAIIPDGLCICNF